MVNTPEIANADSWLALTIAGASNDLVTAAGVLLTLLGLWFQWQRHGQLCTVEEEVKNAKLSEAAARRRVKLINLRAMVLTGAGLVLLVVAFAGLAG